MATQEERIMTLEQKVEKLQSNTARSMQEVDENTTILLGVIRHQGKDIRSIFEVLETMNSQLKEHTVLLNQILERLPAQQ